MNVSQIVSLLQLAANAAPAISGSIEGAIALGKSFAHGNTPTAEDVGTMQTAIGTALTHMAEIAGAVDGLGSDPLPVELAHHAANLPTALGSNVGTDAQVAVALSPAVTLGEVEAVKPKRKRKATKKKAAKKK